MHLFLVLFSLQFHEAGWFENVWSVDWLVWKYFKLYKRTLCKHSLSPYAKHKQTNLL